MNILDYIFIMAAESLKLGFQMIYGVGLVIMLVLGVIKAVSLAIRLLAGSSNLHDLMLKRILFSPMSFFDVTPSGRIINRFSKDMDERESIKAERFVN